MRSSLGKSGKRRSKMGNIKSILGFLVIGLAFGVLVLGAPRSVSAQTDSVKKERSDKDDRLTQEDRKNVKVTIEQARATALAVIGGTVVKEELEKERGRVQYTFDIRNSQGKLYDVEIDARTGELIKAVQEESDDGEDDDDDD
jgi:hypothetical protein